MLLSFFNVFKKSFLNDMLCDNLAKFILTSWTYQGIHQGNGARMVMANEFAHRVKDSNEPLPERLLLRFLDF